MTHVNPESPLPALWHEPSPHHFDAAVHWWVKALLVAAATIAAILWLDRPLAAWVLHAPPIDEKGAWHFKNDIVRELAMLEQWGQWVCSVIVIAAVALLDRAGGAGKRRALAIALGCLCTVLLTYLLKDLFGRSRPWLNGDGSWTWGGPAQGFTGGSKWSSFPSAHTTGAFALSVGLSWFYPKARALFMTLAAITALQRILHGAHFLSDVLAGLGISVLVTRWTFQAKLAGRLLTLLPRSLQNWYVAQ